MKYRLQFIGLCFLALLYYNTGNTQIPATAVNADPSATEIRLNPLSPTIAGTATMVAVLENASTTHATTGTIPANSCYLTISFPMQYGIQTVPTVPNFTVYYSETGPSGTLHLINSVAIAPGDVLEASFTITGYSTSGTGTTTYNVDRVTPIITANKLTANDNSEITLSVSSVLPVKLEYFNAKAATGNSCNAALSWKTSLEENSSHFDIEYSADGVSFSKVNTIAAQGNSNGKLYEIVLPQADATGFYRLKMVDIDGKFLYSEVQVLKLNCGAGNYLKVYPTIVTDPNADITVSYRLSYKGRAQLIVTSSLGQLFVNKAIVIPDTGINTERLSHAQFIPGSYFLTITDEHGKRLAPAQKIVIQ